MKKNLICLTLLTVFSFGSSALTVEHHVFLDDVQFVNENVSRVLIASKEINIGRDFKTKLPAGKWVMYSINSKDSSKKDLSKHIFAVGYFDKDSLRTGVFEYRFAAPINKPQDTLRPFVFVSYNRGLMHGTSFAMYPSGSIYASGQYLNGRKSGLFIDGALGVDRISKIETYEDDSLMSWWYYLDGTLYSQGQVRMSNVVECEIYFNNKIRARGYFTQNEMTKYELYDSTGVIQIIAEGKFKLQKTNFYYESLLEVISRARSPFTGTMEYFDERGIMLKRLNYQNGQVLNE